MERTLEACQVVNHIVPAVCRAGATNGTGVDCVDAIEVSAIISVGAIGDTGADTKLDVKLQDSDDNSTFTDITGAAITQLANTDDKPFRRSAPTWTCGRSKGATSGP